MSGRTCLIALLLLASAAQVPAQDGTAASPLILVSRDGRRAIATSVQGGREVVALDEVARLFQVSVKEDTLAGGITVSYRGKTIVASANRPMASADGRIVNLPSPVVRSGRTWLVPIEFISVALGAIYDQRIDLRRASRMVVVGDIRMPRVTVTVASPGPPTRAEIDIAPATAVTVVPEPGRLILRIDAEALDLVAAPSNAGLIERVRVAPDANTLAISLADGAGTARSAVATAGNTTRVTIDVPAATSLTEPRPGLPDPRSPPPAPGLPVAASRAWQTIALDPGHGGDDVGVRGPGGGEEKQLTLDIARRLRMMIENRLGLRVILTRDDDRAVGLDERASVANNGKADLLISLHLNGARVPTLAGAEIFHLELDRASADVVRAATAEGVALPSLGGGVRRLDLIPWDLAQARHLDESSVLAGVLQEELQRQVPMSDHPLREAPMRLLAAANMPAALVEMGYLTNPEQERRLDSDDFKTAMAQAVFSAIVRFRAWSEESRTP